MFKVVMVVDGACGLDEKPLVYTETEAEAKQIVSELYMTDIKEFGCKVDEYFYYEG